MPSRLAHCLKVAGCLLFASLPVVHAACHRAYTFSLMPIGLASYEDDDGRAAGFIPDLYREMARRTGCQLDIHFFPSGRHRALVDRQPVIAPTALDIFSGEPGKLVVPLFKDPLQMVVPQMVAEHFDLDTFVRQGHTIGILRGASYGHWGDDFLERVPSAQKVVINNIDSVYKMLDAGRIDATLANTFVYVSKRKLFRDVDQFTAVPLNKGMEAQYGILFNLHYLAPEDGELLVRTVETIRDDGTFCTLMTRHLDPHITQHMCHGMEHVRRLTGASHGQ